MLDYSMTGDAGNFPSTGLPELRSQTVTLPPSLSNSATAASCLPSAGSGSSPHPATPATKSASTGNIHALWKLVVADDDPDQLTYLATVFEDHEATAKR